MNLTADEKSVDPQLKANFDKVVQLFQEGRIKNPRVRAPRNFTPPGQKEIKYFSSQLSSNLWVFYHAHHGRDPDLNELREMGSEVAEYIDRECTQCDDCGSFGPERCVGECPCGGNLCETCYNRHRFEGECPEDPRNFHPDAEWRERHRNYDDEGDI